MAIALVQTAAIGSNGAGASQATSNFGANPTVGNYIVAWAWGWTGVGQNLTTVVFTDTGGNAYTLPANAFQQQTDDVWIACAYTKIVTGGGTFHITCTPTHSGGSTSSIMVVASEFSGVISSSPTDGAAVGTTGTSVTVAPGSKSITGGSLVVSVCSDDNTSYGGSTPTGFNRVANQTNGSTFEVGEAIYAIDPASPTNPSRTITSAKWAAAQFALRVAYPTVLGGNPDGASGFRQMAQLLAQ